MLWLSLDSRGGGGGTPMRNRRGCSSEILNLTPKGDQSGRGLSKFRPLKETT